MEAVKQEKYADYNQYHFTVEHQIIGCFVTSLLLFGIGMLFYMNVYLSIVLAAGGWFYPRWRRPALIASRKQQLQLAFKQALYALSTSLAAGKSVENAFREVMSDLQLIYPDSRADLIHELRTINIRVDNGEPIERAIADFSRRASIADITDFSEVFITCKRSGGDLIEVMRKASHHIGEKMEMKQEIEVMIAHKRFESKLLCFIPFPLIAVLTLSSPDYMKPLYNWAGHAIMTGALLAIGGCFWLTQKWIKIEV